MRALHNDMRKKKRIGIVSSFADELMRYNVYGLMLHLLLKLMKAFWLGKLLTLSAITADRFKN